MMRVAVKEGHHFFPSSIYSSEAGEQWQIVEISVSAGIWLRCKSSILGRRGRRSTEE
jgi:hypothetical protein